MNEQMMTAAVCVLLGIGFAFYRTAADNLSVGKRGRALFEVLMVNGFSGVLGGCLAAILGDIYPGIGRGYLLAVACVLGYQGIAPTMQFLADFKDDFLSERKKTFHGIQSPEPPGEARRPDRLDLGPVPDPDLQKGE